MEELEKNMAIAAAKSPRRVTMGGGGGGGHSGHAEFAAHALPAGLASRPPAQLNIVLLPNSSDNSSVGGEDSPTAPPPPPPPPPSQAAVEKPLPSEREVLLSELFHAMDDDGSMALSLNEFGQLFAKGVDERTRTLFNAVDMEVSHDGVLTIDEFVQFHLAKFSQLDDETFKRIVTQLTITAEDNVVIDEVAAVAPVEEVQHEPAAREQSAVVLQLKIEASDEHGASIRIF